MQNTENNKLIQNKIRRKSKKKETDETNKKIAR